MGGRYSRPPLIPARGGGLPCPLEHTRTQRPAHTLPLCVCVCVCVCVAFGRFPRVVSLSKMPFSLSFSLKTFLFGPGVWE